MASRGVALSHNAAGLRFWSSGVHEIGESARRNEAERHGNRRTFISQLNTHRQFLKPTNTSETCGSATSQSSREVCEFLQPTKPLNPEDFSPVGRFAPSRQWQRPPQPRSRWETGCCRPSIARAMWVTCSLSYRPKLTFPDTTQLEPYFEPPNAAPSVWVCGRAGVELLLAVR